MRRYPRRIFAAALLCLAVAPGLWWRTGLAGKETGKLWFEPLSVAAPAVHPGGPVLVGAWRLVSDDWRSFGYSALVVQPDGRLRAYTDFNRWAEFAPPGSSRTDSIMGIVPGMDSSAPNDLEAAAYDSTSNVAWLAYEKLNSVRRVGPNEEVASAAPPAMASFRWNGGAEAMARLNDGRFVVIAERGAWRYPLRRTALLFKRDPILDPAATLFSFDPPLGDEPTDAATLPDGRVLILLRGLSPGHWPPFRSKLVLADPVDIRAGESWPWRELVDLSRIAPRENYEGVAVSSEGSTLAIWLISDANSSVLMQRTLLLKLVWKDWRRPIVE